MNDETYDPNKPRYQEGEFQEILVAMSGLNETDAARPEQLMKQGEEHRKYLIAYMEAQLRNHREAFSGRLSKRARFWRQSPNHMSMAWRLLLDLYKHEDTAYAEMQREVRCSPTKLKEILNEGEALGLLVIEQDADDNRRRIIRPTWLCMHEWEARHFRRLQKQVATSNVAGLDAIRAFEEFCDKVDETYLLAQQVKGMCDTE